MFTGSKRSTPGSLVFKFELEGGEQLKAALMEMGQRKMKNALRGAVTFGITPLLAAAKKGVPRDTGQLKLSMSKVVRTYPSGVVVGVVGPAKGFRGHFTDKKGRLVLRNPTKYAHLVELGHRIAVGGRLRQSVYESLVNKPTGRVGGFVQGFHFMSIAYTTTKDQVERRIAQKLAEHISKAGLKSGT